MGRSNCRPWGEVTVAQQWGPRLPDAEGPSWIRVALRESGAVVAAELRGDALEGARFKIRFPAPNEPAGDAPETPFCKVKTESTAPFQPTLTPIADGCMVTQSLCRYPASGFTERFEREFPGDDFEFVKWSKLRQDRLDDLDPGLEDALLLGVPDQRRADR